MNLDEYIEMEAQRRFDELLQEAEQTGKTLRQVAADRGLI